MEKIKDSDFTFDFSGRKQDVQRKEELKQKLEKFKSFKKMGTLALILILSLTLVGFSVKAIHESTQEKINESIKEKELILKEVPKIKIVELIERERDVVKSLFNKNEKLLKDYDKYKELIATLTLNTSIVSKRNSNNKLFKETLELLDYEQKEIDKIIFASSASRDVKKKCIINWKFSRYVSKMVYKCKK